MYIIHSPRPVRPYCGVVYMRFSSEAVRCVAHRPTYPKTYATWTDPITAVCECMRACVHGGCARERDRGESSGHPRRRCAHTRISMQGRLRALRGEIYGRGPFSFGRRELTALTPRNILQGCVLAPLLSWSLLSRI